MSDAQVALASGLGGALIGALAALGGQALAGWQRSRADRRRERIDLVSRFWAAADRLWVASESLMYTILDQQASREAGHHEVVTTLNERRLKEISDRREATSEARFLLAQMRLLHPVLAEPGQKLFDASKDFTYDTAKADREARVTALDEFEAAATRAV